MKLYRLAPACLFLFAFLAQDALSYGKDDDDDDRPAASRNNSGGGGGEGGGGNEDTASNGEGGGGGGDTASNGAGEAGGGAGDGAGGGSGGGVAGRGAVASGGGNGPDCSQGISKDQAECVRDGTKGQWEAADQRDVTDKVANGISTPSKGAADETKNETTTAQNP